MPKLLDRLDDWKHRFGPPETGQLERLLEAVAKYRVRDAAGLIRLHETLLFLRAYPRTTEVARCADAILFAFAGRVARLRAAGVDLEPFAEPEVSGIAGTDLTAVFSFEVARSLVERHGRAVHLAWDAHDEMHRVGPGSPQLAPLIGEEWPVEAHVPFERWLAAARPRAQSELPWLLERARAAAPDHTAERYNAMGLPLTWEIGRRVSRSRQRAPVRGLFCHSEPLIARRDISLARELASPPLAVKRLPPTNASKMLDLILDTSAMRFRELYGFSHPDEANVFSADAGRGVEIVFFGLPPRWRLPLRAYHAGMFFKNGVPAGYVETLSLFDHAGVGFNLYYTFREGESAWLYARLLRLFHQVLGINYFSVDPYQIGDDNPEAIDSGAFWFYRKLGFRPVDPRLAALTRREEERIARTPGYRSSHRTLRRLAKGRVLFEGPGAEAGQWDRFSIRNVGIETTRALTARFGSDTERMRNAASRFAARHFGVESTCGLALALSAIPGVASWSPAEKKAVAAILQAKERGSETRYLHLMQRHPTLRAALLKLGR
ncbi:MAG: hypothetical protein ABSH00_10420 [Bryobacteraceae bacterium]|jgi:hypothetical protein